MGLRHANGWGVIYLLVGNSVCLLGHGSWFLHEGCGIFRQVGRYLRKLGMLLLLLLAERGLAWIGLGLLQGRHLLLHEGCGIFRQVGRYLRKLGMLLLLLLWAERGLAWIGLGLLQGRHLLHKAIFNSYVEN
jgi:hypothetical protein